MRLRARAFSQHASPRPLGRDLRMCFNPSAIYYRFPPNPYPENGRLESRSRRLDSPPRRARRERRVCVEETPPSGYVKDHCDRKPGSTSGYPFGEKHLVFKVRGKIFAVLHVEESPVEVTLKADPELTRLLRGTYPAAIHPAPYFHKRYWNTLTCDGTVPDDEVMELIDTSYDIVFQSLKKSDGDPLKASPGR